jgi:Protein of unknown function (DUF3604)
MRASIIVLFLGLAAATPGAAQELDLNVHVNPQRQAYFGDLHLHTSNSLDATWAGVRTTPADAYTYAQGLPVRYFGREVKRRAPLDFLAVSDHAEYMGVTRAMLDKHPDFEGTNWYESLTSGNRPGFDRLMGAVFRGAAPLPELNSEPRRRTTWSEVVRVANQFNRPGKFTAFVAFEWSDTPGGAHNHRVSIFRGPAYPELPFSALDSRNPLDLWRYADANRARGIDSVLIPHNSNLSNGVQFSYLGPDGQPMGREYAQVKARNETLVEVTQVKGTSETHPLLSPEDEFAGFEILDHYIGDRKAANDGSFVRQAYARGMEIAERTGVNPFQFGMVGSSDYHSATSATEEDNNTGALGDSDFPFGENVAKVLQANNPLLRQPMAILSASGITGVWAEQNTRESIFAAFRRKEVFATSGPRMQVRLFAGFDFPAGLVNRSDFLAQAYAKGVAMGGTLPRASGKSPPRLLVQALKDPDGANLDRIQIVKVWRTGGQSHEKVFDVAWSGNRKPDPRTGKVPEVGNTVDVKSATYSNSIGAAQLVAEWVDPAFDPGVPAVYYARVIEIPSPRWPTFLAVRNNMPLPTATPPTLQERAWTSPVFYQP